MFLKALTLKGFKSFADPTTLEFEPGVTVVVGPNGSGKSNIVDAVAWVLGAQGPRTVRSSKMDDVIFAGSPGRPPLGRSEVSLVIDNSAGRIPVPMSEITITRTLFRSGDSDYALNHVPCRLLDVQELLSDTGVGRQQHVIVGQGQLDAVLNARPEERRLMVEEAAGVLKYRRRRERAERRLEATEANLLRLQDLLREVRRQLRPLERQAEAARRYDEVANEARSLRLYLSGRDIADLATRRDSCSDARRDLSDEEGSLRSRLTEVDADVARREVRQDSVNSAGTGRLLGRLEALSERAKGLAAVLAERQRSLAGSRRASLDQDVAAGLLAERADLSARLGGVEEDVAEAAGALATLADAGARVVAGRAREEDLAKDVLGARERLSALRHGLERDAAEKARLDDRSEALARRAGAISDEASRQRAEVERRSADSELLADEVHSCEAALAVASAKVDAAEAALREAERGSDTWSARAEGLAEALEEDRARSGAARLRGVDGVVGALTELVEVDTGWERAFEAGASDVVSAVVVSGAQGARSAVARLREEGASAVVLPAADPVSARRRSGAERQDGPLPAGAGTLRSHVRATSEGVGALLDSLLDDVVVVVGGWEEALDLHLQRRDLSVVTRDGDRFSPRGWAAGGSRTEIVSSFGIEDARRQAAELSVAAAEAAGDLELARDELAAAQLVLAERSRARATNEAQLRSESEAHRGAERHLSDVQDELSEVDARRAELLDETARGRESTREIEGSLRDLEAEVAASVGRSAELTRAVTERNALEVRRAALGERRELLSSRLVELDQRLAACGPGEDEGRLGEVEADARAVNRLAQVVDSCRELLEAEAARASEARRFEEDTARQMREALEVLRRHRSEVEGDLSSVLERAKRAEIEEAEVRLRLEAACDAVRRDLDCEPEAAMEAPTPVLDPGTSAQQRVRELERELRLMGPVNPLAKQEMTSLSERHELLASQLDDVRSARRELGKLIRAVDSEIVEVFASAYAEVAENFSILFETLFPGGQGKTHLTEPDDLLTTGIEVDARPAGRGVRKLSLLSGGERSLVALAFLFAVFRSRPSPFYILDEVEAALDDVNLVRFLDLLKEFRSDAQLIVVSHQQRTMGMADCLYGVTMQPGGSSRVLSERAREVESA